MRQIAKSYLAELFCGTGPESPLAAALTEQLSESDVALFGAFEAAVVVTVSQQLFRQWWTNDPVSAKLWNNLRKVLKHDPRFHRFPVEEPEWITLVNAESLRDSATPWNDDELLQLACETPSEGAPLGDFVTALLSEVANQPDRCQAVRIDQLFSAIRQAVNQNLRAEIAFSADIREISPDLRITIELAQKQLQPEIAGIIAGYAKSGKLKQADAICLSDATSDLLHDYGEFGEAARSFIEYLQAHLPDLSEEEYRTRFKTRFEYLARLAKVRLAEILRENWK
jgi:hypothetical protein